MADKFSPKNGKENEKKGVPQEDVAEKLLHQPRVQQAMDWVMLNLRAIAIAAGALFALIVIIMSMVAYQRGVNQKAIALEGKAFTLHQEAQDKARSGQQSAEKTDGAQPEDAYKDALTAYQDVIAAHGDTESGKRAVYMLGSIQLETGKYDKAKQSFEDYLAKSPNGIFAVNAEEGLAYILEQQQKFQEALDAFKKLEGKASAGRQTEIQLAIARNYEALKDIENAKAIYQKIVDSNTAASLKNKAKDRLEILEAQQKVALGAVTPAPQETPTAEVTQAEQAATPVEAAPTAVPTQETPAAEATQAEQAAPPVEASPTADPTQETPAAEVTQAEQSATPVEAAPTAAPTQETPTAEATQAEQAATPVEAAPTAAPTQETPAAEATQAEQAATPVEAAPTAAPTQETPAAEATPTVEATATPAQGN